MATKKLKYNPDYVVHKYAQNIVDGKIVAYKLEILLAKKHLKDLKRQGTKSFPYIFDETRAERFFKFAEMCYNAEQGEYFKLLDHQKFDFGLQYGWVKQHSGALKHTRIYKQQSRGNAKTTECAIEAPYKLAADRIYPPYQPDDYIKIQNAQIQLMAVDRLQVEELRDPIVSIVNNSPKIKKVINARASYIKGIKSGGSIKVLSKEVKNKMGGKPYFVIVDELSSHDNGDRLSAVEKGLGKRDQAQIKIVTTPGDCVETNPAKKEYDYAKLVLKGEIIDESFLGIIREQDEKDDISNTALWGKSNPFLRYLPHNKYSCNLFETIQKEYKRAFEGNDPEAKRKFKIYRMGLWQEQSVNSYLTARDIRIYEECRVSQSKFNELVKGKPSIAGFDFSMRRDLTASGYIWQLDDDTIAIDAVGVMPHDTLRSHEQTDRIPYSEYVKLGILFTTLGDMVNKEEFAHIVCQVAAAYGTTIKEICYDPYKAKECVDDFSSGKYDALGAGSFSEDNVIEVGQNNRTLHIPTTLLRDKIRQKKIIHNGNPLLKWCLVNAHVFESKAGELIRIGKENKDSHRRIDLAAAVINALARVDSLKNDLWVERMSQTVDGFF